MQLPDPSIIAKWPAANLVNPETRGPAAIIVVSVLLFVVTVLLALRVYTRIWISKVFGLDDTLILLAYIPTAGFAVISFVAQAKFGWGTHVWDVPFTSYTPALQSSLVSQLLFDLSTSLTKLSIVALIWRVISVGGNAYRYVVIAVAALVCLDGTIFFFLTVFECSPPEQYWTISATPQRCIDQQKHLLAAGIINTTTDFLLVLLPIPCIVRLNLPIWEKMIALSLFAFGLFATVTGAVRTYFTFLFFDVSDADLTWNASTIVVLSAVELFVAIICASIPPTKPFFSRCFPGVFKNPMHRRTRNAPAGASFSPSSDQKKMGPASAVSSTTRNSRFAESFDDDESTIAMPTRGGATPPMPVSRPLMPALRPLTMHPPFSSNYASSSRSASSFISDTTVSTAVLERSDFFSVPPELVVNLNKPLPTTKPVSGLEWATIDEGLDWEENDTRRLTSMSMTSVYKLVPLEGGQMSVQKMRGRGH